MRFKTQAKPKIGLALAGGGVLSAGHIGPLELIEQEQVEVDLVAGTSSGAIAAALFLVGGSALLSTFMDEIAAEASLKKLMQNRSPIRMFQSIERLLKHHLPSEFADLKKPLLVTATEFESGHLKVFSEGNLVKAIMASIAYPGVFPIQKVGGKHYVDGGLTAQLPASILRTAGADFVIGSVHLTPALSGSEVMSLSRVATVSRSLDILWTDQIEKQMAACDFLFASEKVKNYRWYQVAAMEKIRELGRVNAISKQEEFREKIKRLKK